MTETDRLQKLHNMMKQHDLDAVALVPGSNFRYLTRSVHHLSERPIILFVTQQGQAVIVIPSLEEGWFLSHGFEAKSFPWSDADGYENAFKTALGQLNLSGKQIGVEGQTMRFFESEIIRRLVPDMKIAEAHTAISSIRLHKDASEIEALRAAIQLSEEALRRTLEVVRVGMTEREVATILLANFNSLGSQGISFNPITLAGEKTARPHGKVGDKMIEAGDALLFDFGTTHQGYCADITRTVFVGEPSDHQRAIYEAVKKANAVGRETARPGVTCASVDETTAQVLHDSGFSEFILHRTGHGLGLDVHEAPYISRGNEQVLEPGMVFTVEPGLYEPGVVGVRIEDNVVITPDGSESLTTFDRELLVVG